MKNIISYIKNQTSLNTVNILLLAISFFSLFFAAYFERPTMHEGSWWFYILLQTKQFAYDNTLFRHADVFYQLPAWLSIKLFPESLKVPYMLLNFSYMLLPALFLVFNIYLCTVNKMKSVIPLLILSWYFAFFSATGMSVNCTASTVGYFWTIFILILKKEPRAWVERGFIVLLYLALAFSYDMASILLPLLLFLHCYNFYTYSNTKSKVSEIFLIVACNLCIFVHIYRLHRVLTLHSPILVDNLIYFLLEFSNPYIFHLLFFCLIFSFVQLALYFKWKLKNKLLIGVGIFILANFILFLSSTNLYSSNLFLYTRSNRFFSMPILFFFGFWTLIVVLKKLGSSEQFYKINNLFISFVAAAFITTDIFSTMAWNHYYTVYKQLSTKQGCNFIDKSWLQEFGGSIVIRTYNSIISQNSLKIDRITLNKPEDLEGCSDREKIVTEINNQALGILNHPTTHRFDYTHFINGTNKN
jgi:hypothetical protein